MRPPTTDPNHYAHPPHQHHPSHRSRYTPSPRTTHDQNSSNEEDSISTDYSDHNPARQLDDARSSDHDSSRGSDGIKQSHNNRKITHQLGHTPDEDEGDEEDEEDEDYGDVEDAGEGGTNVQPDGGEDDDEDDNSNSYTNYVHDEYNDDDDDNLALRPVSTPNYSDIQLDTRRASSVQSSRLSLYSQRVAEAARAARDHLGRRWSFHRRPTHEPPLRTSHRPTSPTNGYGRIPPSVDHRSDFLASAFTFPLGHASIHPLGLPSNSAPLSPLRPPIDAITIPVKSWVLTGNGTIPRKNSRISSLSKRLGPKKYVTVESNVSGLTPMMLYGSDQVSTTTRAEPFKATESITSRPEYVDRQSIVYNDSPFEISVVGMSISSEDFKLGYPDCKDVLLYSMHREPGEQGEEGDTMPFIHYDPTQDDGLRGVQPDQFVPIPASKSLFMASDGGPSSRARKSINCRFKLIELDRVDDSIQSSLAGIEQLGNHLQQYAVSAPALGLLTPAISLASVVSKRAVESHSTSDRMIMIDMNFLLADRCNPQVNHDGTGELPFESRSGEYLRYGYYFFLARGVEAKLYASFRTFPNVGLMLKRVDKPAPNEKQFFPLTGVSYLVIRVTPRLSGAKVTRKPIRLRHVQRLEELMSSSMLRLLGDTNGESCETLVRKLAILGEELGITSYPKRTGGKTMKILGHVNTSDNGMGGLTDVSRAGEKTSTGENDDKVLQEEGGTYSTTMDAFALTGLADWSGNRGFELVRKCVQNTSGTGQLERSASLTAVDGDRAQSSGCTPISPRRRPSVPNIVRAQSSVMNYKADEVDVQGVGKHKHSIG